MRPSNDRARYVAGIILLIYGAYSMGWLGGGSVIAAPISRVTYIYEKGESGGVPPTVQFVLREINTAGKIAAAAIEVDIKDSTGSTPPQYKIAVDAAKAAGLPQLVVQAGDKVVRIVPDTKDSPLTEQKIREAVQ